MMLTLGFCHYIKYQEAMCPGVNIVEHVTPVKPCTRRADYTSPVPEAYLTCSLMPTFSRWLLIAAYNEPNEGLLHAT